MYLINHIRDDWMCRLPYRLQHATFRRAEKLAYALFCVLYYALKSVIVLYFVACFKIIKFLTWDVWKMLYDKFHTYEDEEDEEYEEAPCTNIDMCESVDDLRFVQLFEVGADMCLLVDHIEMCPDETAFIRVVDEEGYTPLYKRKVRRDKTGNRFILFNGTHHYLDDKKTQPAAIHK